jgi:hypothetical protein
MIHEKQSVISGALDGKVSDYNILAKDDINFEKTLSAKKLEKEKKKKKTIFDFEDFEYDMTRI